MYILYIIISSGQGGFKENNILFVIRSWNLHEEF